MKPVSKTAYYCCGVRMADAESKRPICGDNYARRFMDAEALAYFAQLKTEKRAARSNATRARMIDDLLRAALQENPNLNVLTIGAGFDSRPYRLQGGSWIELDEPALIALKNEKLPIAECKNKLTRVAIDFASETLVDKLAAYKTKAATLIVLEGVLMYLTQETIADTLETLRRLFAHHTLICDLMRLEFVEKRSGTLRKKLEQHGAMFRPVADPHAVFVRNGYRLLGSSAVVPRALELSLPPQLGILSRFLPKDLARGYTVNVFVPAAASAS